MATDPGKRPATLWHLGGGIVWAAGAEIRCPAERHDIAAAELAFFCLQKGEAFGYARRGMEAGNALRNHTSDLGRRQLTVRRQYPVAILVEFADDARTDVFPPIVELFLKLVLDHCALFFDDQDLFESLGKVSDALTFERPRHRDLIKAEADFSGMRLVNPQIIERLAHIKVGFAGCNDPEPWLRAVDDDLVQPVRACESQGGVKFVLMQPIFLLERLIGPANIEPAGRHLEITGQHNIDT